MTTITTTRLPSATGSLVFTDLDIGDHFVFVSSQDVPCVVTAKDSYRQLSTPSAGFNTLAVKASAALLAANVLPIATISLSFAL